MNKKVGFFPTVNVLINVFHMSTYFIWLSLTLRIKSPSRKDTKVFQNMNKNQNISPLWITVTLCLVTSYEPAQQFFLGCMMLPSVKLHSHNANAFFSRQRPKGIKFRHT